MHIITSKQPQLADMAEAVFENNDDIERPVLFNRQDVSDCFRRARQMIIDNKLLRICVMEVDGERRQLTICNLWRIIREPNTLQTQEFNLVTQQWEDQDDLSTWPVIPFFPYARTRSLKWWRDLMRSMLDKVIAASGFKVIPDRLSLSEFQAMHPHRDISTDTPQISKRKVIGRLYNRYASPSEEGGVCTEKSMVSGVRALRAALFEHILDKDIIKLLMIISHSRIGFIQYLHTARSQAGFRKVASENRHLLPLLSGIDPSLWGLDDLFSRSRWVSPLSLDDVIHAYNGRYCAERLTPLVMISSITQKVDPERVISTGKRDYLLSGESITLQSLHSKGSWRWLMRSSPVVISSWIRNGANPLIPTLIVNSGFSGKAPVIAYTRLICDFSRMATSCRNMHHHMTLIRLILQHTEKMWKEAGFKRTQSWIAHAMSPMIDGVIDYLNDEGFAAGLPDKNSSLISLMARSERWHRLIRETKNTRNLSWKSLLGATTIDGIVVTPIETSLELFDEGYDMHHCVSSYDAVCARGEYRVFSLKSADGVRSTLGLWCSRGVTIQQHYSVCNSPPSKKDVKVAKKVLKAYEALFNEQGHVDELSSEDQNAA